MSETFYEQWQLEHHGNILPAATDECFESGVEERNRTTDHINQQAELELIDKRY